LLRENRRPEIARPNGTRPLRSVPGDMVGIP
jgi:hypothetical protein